jgi:hypothetical protein
MEDIGECFKSKVFANTAQIISNKMRQNCGHYKDTSQTAFSNPKKSIGVMQVKVQSSNFMGQT